LLNIRHQKKDKSMKKLLFGISSLCLALSAFGENPHAPEDLSDNQNPGPPFLSIMWARGVETSARVGEARKTSPNMVYHGGKILPTVNAKAIFWGQSWSNPTFVGDKMTGLDSWYTGFSGSDYAKTSDEYTGNNGQVGPSLVYAGHLVDTSTAPGGNNTSPILAEVCKMITSPDTTGDGYYPVYVDTKRGSAQFCAWHSAGSCSVSGKQVAVQFAFFFNLDGDPGCNPNDTTTTHSQGLAALANVSGHELSEARTDPSSPGAWYDSTGEENGDKCAWTFNVPSVTFPNGTQWKIQGEWSNAAYTAGTGYPNSSGQNGCLDGH
jgi:hypothetical protein